MQIPICNKIFTAIVAKYYIKVEVTKINLTQKNKINMFKNTFQYFKESHNYLFTWCFYAIKMDFQNSILDLLINVLYLRK